MARLAPLPARRPTALLRGWAIVAALLIGAAGAAHGQDQPAHPAGAPVRTIGSKPAFPVGGPCVRVDIAGDKAGYLDCSAQELGAAVKSAQRRAQTTANLAASDARSADVVTGVANQTATRQRMGNTFGVSARPQRAVSVPISPRGLRP